MIKFIFFFLSFVANLIIIKMMPDDKLRDYINIYNMVGAFGALAFFLIYAREAFAWHVRKVGFFLLFVYGVLNILMDSFWASAVLYPLFLICNDYIVTQSSVARRQYPYRLFLILSALPFFFFESHFEALFQVRVLFLSLILLFYVLETKSVETLKVQSTFKYIFFNYTFYYVPLLVIANMPFTPTALKAWYIFAQGGLVVYLKYLDFAVRSNHTVPSHLNFLILLAAVIAPLLPSVVFSSTGALFVYYIGLSGLVYSKRFINIAIH
jgi:hypothetical protein